MRNCTGKYKGLTCERGWRNLVVLYSSMLVCMLHQKRRKKLRPSLTLEFVCLRVKSKQEHVQSLASIVNRFGLERTGAGSASFLIVTSCNARCPTSGGIPPPLNMGVLILSEVVPIDHDLQAPGMCNFTSRKGHGTVSQERKGSTESRRDEQLARNPQAPAAPGCVFQHCDRSHADDTLHNENPVPKAFAHLQLHLVSPLQSCLRTCLQAPWPQTFAQRAFLSPVSVSYHSSRMF